MMRAIGAILFALTVPWLAAADQSQGDPALDYALQCRGCHLADGSGAPHAGVPDMRGFVGKFTRIEGGRAYLVQVPGVANAPLDDAATASLLNWLLGEFSARELPAEFAPYTPEEVAAHRGAAPIDVPIVRAALLARLDVMGDVAD